jgi:(R,R)-butanediol dehydrogenase/meso-butanediol dehydrogenase/diacetyl reductase
MVSPWQLTEVRAAVYHGAADVRIEDVAAPSPPGADDVLIDVTLASICGSDSAEWAHGPLLVPLHSPHPATGHQGPVILGHEFVGTIAEVGANVSAFSLGDRVVCGAGVSCGSCRWCLVGRTNLCASYYTLGFHAHGGLAERVLAPGRTLRAVPAELEDRSATLAQPLAVALHAVRRSGVAPGDLLVVIGAGGIGAFVIAAAARGIERIVAVDIDKERLATAQRLGATDLLDARAEDALAAIRELSGGDGADVVIEASGAPQSPALAFAAARRGGRAVLVGLQAAPREIDLLSVTIREVDVVTTLAHVCDVDLPEAVEILLRSDLAEDVVDHVIPLDALVDEGLRPLAEGTARGKILVDTRQGTR